MALKVCRTCDIEKDVSLFDKNPTGTHGVRGTCRECRGKDIRNVRKHNIKTKYGLSMDDYTEMYENQDGCCAICNTEIEMYATRDKLMQIANIDHCHTTGKVRALLCNQCNTGLGKFSDDPSLLMKAADYLQKYR